MRKIASCAVKRLGYAAAFPLIAGLPAAALTAQSPTPLDRQIAEAVSALPEELRAGATVMGYRDADTLVVLRRGTNPMTCLADDPRDDRWHVACYHEDLEPFMRRGRELRRGGADRAAVDSVRQAEIAAGTLPMPRHPTALYSWFGDSTTFNLKTGEAEGAQGLYVVYLPYATEATTGISTVRSDERPWLMFPGKPWAHIMISR